MFTSLPYIMYLINWTMTIGNVSQEKFTSSIRIIKSKIPAHYICLCGIQDCTIIIKIILKINITFVDTEDSFGDLKSPTSKRYLIGSEK